MTRKTRMISAFDAMTKEAQEETLKFIELMAKNYPSKNQGVYLAYSEGCVASSSCAVSGGADKSST